MDRKFFGLCGNITTGGNDDERVRLAVGVFEIEATKEDGSGRCDALAKAHFLAYARYYYGCISTCVSWAVGKKRGGGRTVSSEDIEEVKEQWIFNVADVLCPCLLEGSAV